MNVIVRYQDGTERTFPVQMGYTYLTGSFGLNLIDNGDAHWTAEFGNGYVGKEPAAPFNYARIILRLDNDKRVDMMPRILHYKGNPEPGTTGQVEVGFGPGTFDPGEVHILRFTVDGGSWARSYVRKQLVRKHPLLALPNALSAQKTAYEGIANKMFTALRTGAPNAAVGLAELVGVRMPFGDKQAGAAGGDDIDPFPGYQGSSQYALLVHDLTMERHAVQYRDAALARVAELEKRGLTELAGQPIENFLQAKTIAEKRTGVRCDILESVKRMDGTLTAQKLKIQELEKRGAVDVDPPRVETGAVQFDDDWAGVFIRGDNALNYKQSVERAIRVLDGSKLFDAPLVKGQLIGLAKLLASCDAGANGTKPTKIDRKHSRDVRRITKQELDRVCTAIRETAMFETRDRIIAGFRAIGFEVEA